MAVVTVVAEVLVSLPQTAHVVVGDFGTLLGEGDFWGDDLAIPDVVLVPGTETGPTRTAIRHGLASLLHDCRQEKQCKVRHGTIVALMRFIVKLHQDREQHGG
jgi:hypothetical protein